MRAQANELADSLAKGIDGFGQLLSKRLGWLRTHTTPIWLPNSDEYRHAGVANEPLWLVAHTILVTIYHMLSRGEPYNEVGGAYFDRRNVQRVVHRSVARLEDLGFRVSIVPA